MPEHLVKIMRSPVWQGFMARLLNDEFSSYTGETLVPQKSGYMLGSTAALRLVPGAKSQPLHRDQIAYQVRPDPSNPLFTPMVGCLIAGAKCTYKNGATAVITGSHLWPSDRAPKVEECTYAEMEPGSALFTLGSTYHGAGSNKCEKRDADCLRTLFAVFAQRDYYRQDQQEVLSTPIEIARTLPEDILKLAGYSKAVSGVGFVEDHQSPLKYLHKDNTALEHLVWRLSRCVRIQMSVIFKLLVRRELGGMLNALAGLYCYRTGCNEEKWLSTKANLVAYGDFFNNHLQRR